MCPDYRNELGRAHAVLPSASIHRVSSAQFLGSAIHHPSYDNDSSTHCSVRLFFGDIDILFLAIQCVVPLRTPFYRRVP